MLMKNFGHPAPKINSHHATEIRPRFVLRPRRTWPILGGVQSLPQMTLRRNAFPASPVNARLSRAPRLRIAFAMLSLSRRLILETSEFVKLKLAAKVINRFLLPEAAENREQTIPDIIDIIVALEECAAWLKAQQVSPANLILLLTSKPKALLVETAQISNFLNELALQLSALGNTKLEETLREAVVKCIVKSYEVSPQIATYLVQFMGDGFLEAITMAVKEKSQAETVSAAPEYEESVETKLSANVGPPPNILFLTYMNHLGQTIAVVNLLKLTPMDLQLITSRPQDFNWSAKSTELGEVGLFNLRQLYLLTRLKEGLHVSLDTGKTLLDSFMLADNPSDLKGYVAKCSQLLAQLIDWDSQEIAVLFTGLHGKAPSDINAPPDPKVATTVADIDWILRMKALCQQTGLPASQLLNLTALHVDSSYKDYLNAANALRATQVQEVT